jgi:CxxC motif-containing protein (DUF1111 family)
MKISLKRVLPIHSAAVALLFLIGTSVGQAQVQLNIQPGVQLGWPTPNTTNTYHLQWSSSSGGTWSDLVVMPGDGTTHTLFDPVPSGYRLYQDLEIVPGTPPSAALPANSGFESGTGPIASNWTTDTAVGGPVYGVRTNDSPHSGSFNYLVHLASTGAGPLVQFSQAGVPVTGGTTYPFSFYSKAQASSQGQSGQWRITWSPGGGDTGFQGFTPGNNVYALFSTSVNAPAGATNATIFFHIAGAAVTNFTANIDFDDVVLGSGSSNPGSPAGTNVLSVTTMPVANISWLSASNILYYAESTTDPATVPWTNNFGLFIGNGGTESFLAPMTNSAMFFHLRIPPVTVLPPTGLHQVPSGSTNAIGVAWTASISPGVTGYRVSYGDISTTTTNTTDLGNVTSTIISGLTSGETYFVSVIALSPNGQSDPANATITAQPDTSIGIIPLYNAFTTLQPETTVDTPSALLTYMADRARDRHARESTYAIYDHYLSWYWEQRTIGLQIADTVPKGGNSITFTYQTGCQLDAKEFRAGFLGVTTVAQYMGNTPSTLITTNYNFDYYYPNPLTTNVYTVTITANPQNNQSLHVGDRIEVEISQFLNGQVHGRANYYGTVFLYIVGQGVVPWGSSAVFCDQTTDNDGPVVAGIRTNIDSYPLPTNAWLGGKTTLPYQYSNEPSNRFKETAGNISPTNAQPFMLGRRLHETDFGNGLHAERDGTGTETDNPVYTEQIGKLGPKFTNRSCVSCHVGNGRALPPTTGAPMIQSVVRVGSDASGTPDPVLGSVLQPQNTSGSAEDSVWISSYTTVTNTYGDGTPYTLQKPNYTFSPYTPAFYSVRIAPQLVGMGLLEAVSETTVEALADPSDSDSDGISGRFSTVTDPETGLLRLGRFGYKAGKDSVRHQIAGALNTDMGVTTTIFPVLDGDSSSGPVELLDGDLTNWTSYISLLGVAARRSLSDPQALQGEALFGSASCWKCHTPTLTTSSFHPMTELRKQTIHPYTDLLLHDMGPGLADNMGEGTAAGSEWRTPPLWSIGLTAGVSLGEAYLHDGRARSLEEAILWHDGEGAAAREAFRNMSASDRAALIAFLKSL